MTSDGSGGHQYAYDDEGRVCAMSTGISSPYYWGYLYDAEGHRVAKGSISSLDCSLVNGDSFAVTEYYIIGPDGAPITVLDGSGNWKHTDVPAGPGTMAVYDGDGLHFRLSDWLGSHRVQTDYQGTTPVEDTYQSLPFGELLGSSAGATQKHFTGKERDAESGLDYFGARYYGSNMGRWMSADWADKPEAVPYSILTDPQSLNLYSYVRNHPINSVDADGHACEGFCQKVQNLFGYGVFKTNSDRDAYLRESMQNRPVITAEQSRQLEAFNTAVTMTMLDGVAGQNAALDKSVMESTSALVGAEVSTITQNAERGLQSEARVLDSIGETKNTTPVSTAQGRSIPDFMNTKVVGEIKDAKVVNNTEQLRIQKEAAKQANREHQLITGVNTKVSKPAAAGTTVIRRKDLGPQ